jgi:acyl carrier protein
MLERIPPPSADAARGPSTEALLLRIWSEVLDLPSHTITPDASFIELDGDSMQAVLVINRIIEAFGVDLALDSVFDHTLRSMAADIDSSVQALQVMRPIDRAE